MPSNSLGDEIASMVGGFISLFLLVIIVSAIISTNSFPDPGDPLYPAAESLKEAIALTIILASLLLGVGSWIINELTGNGRR